MDVLRRGYNAVTGTNDVSGAQTSDADRGGGVMDFLHSVTDRVLGKKEDAPPPAAPAAPPPPPDPQPHYTSDPTLDHNNQNCNPTLSDQPLVGPGEKWDGAKILNAQSQLETTDPDWANNQQSRCGPSAVLGSAVMQGPGATARVAERLATRVQDKSTQSALLGIRDRVNNGTATHEDLSHLQQAMYDQYHTPGTDPGLSPDELTSMQQDLCDHADVPPAKDDTNLFGERAADGTSQIVEQPGRTPGELAGLKNGQSMVMFVNTSGDHKAVNHYVAIGKDSSGRSYVYDPYPRDNHTNVVYQDQDDKGYGHYVDGSAGQDVTPQGGRPTRVNVFAGGVVSYDG